MKISRRETVDRFYLLQFRGYAIFLHHIKKDDPHDTLHTHPWNAISFILGAYIEHRLGLPTRWRIGFNRLKASVPHRVTLPMGPVWTLFFHGPRCNEWGVFDLEGRLLDREPWRGVENEARTAYRP